MKIVRNSLILFILIFCISFIISKPYVMEYFTNKYDRVLSGPPYDIASEAAKELHKSLSVCDLHCDALMWGRDLLEKNESGHVDIPRMIEGNIALQVFSVPTKVPWKVSQWGTNPDQFNTLNLAAIFGGWPLSTWFNLTERALYNAKELNDFAAKSSGQFMVIRNSKELDEFLKKRISNKNLTAGILAIEGLHSLEGNLDALDEHFDAGYRIMGLVHQFDNRIGGSSYGMERGGLTEFGFQVVKKMQEKDMIVDLAHASDALIKDVLKITTNPVIVTHTGVKGVCDRRRNISDEQIVAIAKTGGLIGIGFMRGAVCGITAGDIAKSIRYVADLVGLEYVSLGSDFDGDNLNFDATGMVQVTGALMKENFSNEEIGLIMGGNIIRLLRSSLPKN